MHRNVALRLRRSWSAACCCYDASARFTNASARGTNAAASFTRRRAWGVDDDLVAAPVAAFRVVRRLALDHLGGHLPAHGGGCMLHSVGCMLHGVGCMLHSIGCRLRAVRCVLSGVRTATKSGSDGQKAATTASSSAIADKTRLQRPELARRADRRLTRSWLGASATYNYSTVP